MALGDDLVHQLAPFRNLASVVNTLFVVLAEVVGRAGDRQLHAFVGQLRQMTTGIAHKETVAVRHYLATFGRRL